MFEVPEIMVHNANTITVVMPMSSPSFVKFCKLTPENEKKMKIVNFHNFGPSLYSGYMCRIHSELLQDLQKANKVERVEHVEKVESMNGVERELIR